MEYATLRTLHVTCAALTGLGFLLRGIWMIVDSPLRAARLTRTLPHVVDTALLASAIAMAMKLQVYPFTTGWLTAKVIALVVYILVGMAAFRFAKTRRTRITCWIAALCTYVYIVGVAITRSPALS